MMCVVYTKMEHTQSPHAVRHDSSKTCRGFVEPVYAAALHCILNITYNACGYRHHKQTDGSYQVCCTPPYHNSAKFRCPLLDQGLGVPRSHARVVPSSKVFFVRKIS